jgi:ABC-2 type transport system permease protein
MRDQVRAEWTKVRGTPAIGWALLAVAAATVALSAAAAAATPAEPCPRAGCEQDVARIALSGVQLGQAGVAMLAVLLIGGEYGSGLIRTTLLAMPRRTDVLAAKAVVLTALTAAVGAVGVLGSLLVGWLVLPGNGFDVEHGHRLLTLADGSVLRAVAGSVLYLVLIALLGLGVGAVVRDPGPAVGVVLGLLYLFPLLAVLSTDPQWQRLVRQLSPMDAGLAVQATTPASAALIAPWAGLGVLALWAAAAVGVGGLSLRLRDA